MQYWYRAFMKTYKQPKAVLSRKRAVGREGRGLYPSLSVMAGIPPSGGIFGVDAHVIVAEIAAPGYALAGSLMQIDNEGHWIPFQIF